MKWFRQHIKTGSRLALFALALQFVLSFGHFHFSAALASTAVHAVTDHTHAVAVGSDQAEQPQSGHDDDHRLSSGPCAICAVMSLAFATVAMLPLPDTVQVRSLLTSVELADPGSPWPAFRSRAPPAS